MRKALFILLLLPVLTTAQTTVIVNSYQFAAPGGGGAPTVTDADAQAYIDAVHTACACADQTEADAVDNYVIAEKADNTWNAFTGMYYFGWNNAAANAINMKTPGTYDLSFTGGTPTVVSNGITWGSPVYATAGLDPADFGQNSVSVSVYCQTSGSTNTGVEIGVVGASSNRFSHQIRANTTLRAFYLNQTAAMTTSHGGVSHGFYTVSRTASTTTKAYKNGAQEGSTSATASVAPQSAQQIYFGCLNNNGTAATFSNKTISYYDLGSGLSDAEVASHNTNVEALHDAFSIGVQ